MLFEFANLTYEFVFGAVILSLWEVLLDRFCFVLFGRFGLEGLDSKVWTRRFGLVGYIL